MAQPAVSDPTPSAALPNGARGVLDAGPRRTPHPVPANALSSATPSKTTSTVPLSRSHSQRSIEDEAKATSSNGRAGSTNGHRTSPSLTRLGNGFNIVGAQQGGAGPASPTIQGPAGTLSSPTIVRQHAVAQAPSAMRDQTSTDLLTSARNGTASLPKPVKRTPPPNDTSNSERDRTRSDADHSVKTSGALQSTRQEKEGESAFAQHRYALQAASDERASPSVAQQPPASPSVIRSDADQVAQDRYPTAEQTQQQQQSQPADGQTKEGSTAQPATAQGEEDGTQAPPTIEQRDALAMRVYTACQQAGYDEWVRLLDLAPLASQHHLSGYNCIKFGQQGSPYAYLPLTLQQPMQVQEVMEKQRTHEQQATQWLTQKRKLARQARSHEGHIHQNGHRTASTSPVSPSARAKAPRLEHDQSPAHAASRSQTSRASDVRMREASPLPSSSSDKSPVCRSCNKVYRETVPIGGPHDSRGYCECGPLKNETVISAEWEAPIGEAAPDQKAGAEGKTSHGDSEATSNPTAKTVDSAPSQEAAVNPSVAIKTSDTHPISISPIIPPELLADISKYVHHGLPAFLVQRLERPAKEGRDGWQTDGPRLIRCRVTQADLCEVAFKAERELLEAAHGQRKPRLLRLHDPTVSEPPPQVIREAVVEHRDEMGQPLDRSIFCETRCVDEESHEVDTSDAHHDGKTGHVSTPAMGNLLLSSCPGKKVRLTGPVRGRGAICRDLGLDLTRIRQIGVGAIVCCLDDDELAFLGAPWSEYEREADRLGIEIIRLPMAEGFSPTDVEATDRAMACVISDYTLRGVHVLVHCRGGVGRAGLIACTWMVKLGLVRSDRDELTFRLPLDALARLSRPESSFSSSPPDDSMASPLRRPMPVHLDMTADVMQTVQRLIETIRRRRSPKAIETAEQVEFLVRFVRYLHGQEQDELRQLAANVN